MILDFNRNLPTCSSETYLRAFLSWINGIYYTSDTQNAVCQMTRGFSIFKGKCWASCCINWVLLLLRSYNVPIDLHLNTCACGIYYRLVSECMCLRHLLAHVWFYTLTSTIKNHKSITLTCTTSAYTLTSTIKNHKSITLTCTTSGCLTKSA